MKESVPMINLRLVKILTDNKQLSAVFSVGDSNAYDQDYCLHMFLYGLSVRSMCLYKNLLVEKTPLRRKGEDVFWFWLTGRCTSRSFVHVSARFRAWTSPGGLPLLLLVFAVRWKAFPNICATNHHGKKRRTQDWNFPLEQTVNFIL